MADVLQRGRASYARHAWGDAHAALLAADRAAPLVLEDLERLAMAAHLVGRDADSADAWARAHHECLRLNDPARAAFKQAVADGDHALVPAQVDGEIRVGHGILARRW